MFKDQPSQGAGGGIEPNNFFSLEPLWIPGDVNPESLSLKLTIFYTDKWQHYVVLKHLFEPQGQ